MKLATFDTGAGPHVGNRGGLSSGAGPAASRCRPTGHTAISQRRGAVNIPSATSQ